MAVTVNATYTQAVDLYVAHNHAWLNDGHTPLVTNLYGIAQQLDRRVSAGLATEFRQSINSLQAMAPEQPKDEVAPKKGSDEAFLKSIGL